MTAFSREKIALVVFVLLVLVGIGSLVAYLNIGHNWNVTAAQIDDATGELEGYTAILYAGTAENEQPAVGAGKGSSSEGAGASSASTEDGSEGEGASASAATRKPDGAFSAGSEDSEDSSSEAKNETAGAGEEAGSSESSGSGASSPMFGGSTPLFASNRSTAKEKDFVTVKDAAASYRDKQATVFVLDVENPAQYAEGMILKKGDRRIGVFSVSFNEPLPSVQAKVDYLREYAVDFVVAITPDRGFVERATGIDIAISLKNEGASFMGGSVNGTFYADAPLTGQVGSILVSPYNVVSAKDIEEL